MAQESGSGPGGLFIRRSDSIDRLADVDTTGKSQGECLAWDASGGNWVPGPCGTSGGDAASLSEWETFTPTGSWTSNVSYVGKKRRVGDTLEVFFSGTLTGSPNSTSLNITLPDSLSIDIAKLASPSGSTPLGFGMLEDASVGLFPAIIIYGNATILSISYQESSGSNLKANDISSNIIPFAWGSGDKFYGYFKVPISGWTIETSASASSLDVSLGGVSITSPTVSINFSSNVFTGSESPTDTSLIGINFSSITALGNTFNAANKLLQLDSSGLVPNSLIDSSSVTKLGNVIDLGTDTSGIYVASITAGAGITVSASGVGAAQSVTLTPATLVGDQIWDDASNTFISWSWDIDSGTDPSFVFSDNLIYTPNQLQAETLTANDGTITNLNTSVLTATQVLIGGKNPVLLDDTLTDGTTIYIASGTIVNLYTSTLTFSDGTTMTTAATGSGGGGSFWIGEATSSLNMAGYAIFNSTEIVTSSFSVTGASVQVNSVSYVYPASVGTNSRLQQVDFVGGKAVISYPEAITDGMQRSSTDTVTAAKVFQSSVTLPTSDQVIDVNATGEIMIDVGAYTTNGSSSTLVYYADGQKYYVVATTGPPPNDYIPKYDAELNQWSVEVDTGSSGGTGSPGGSDTEVQFNNSGVFDGISVATFNSSNNTLYFSSAVYFINGSALTFLDMNINLEGISGIYIGGSAGTSGQVLTSGGDGVAPSWETASGGGASDLDDLTDVVITAPAKNQTLIHNGTTFVNAAQGTSFTFEIASFSDGNSSTIEIGTGVWKAAGDISFTATYSNGPPIGSTVTITGWSALPMSGAGLVGPTASVASLDHPSVAGTRVFTLSATDGTDNDTAAITHTFVNRRFWGVSTTASGFTEGDVEGLAGTELSNSKTKTFSVTPGSGEYIVFAYPSRLGTATASVNGFEGGFNSPETVSVTNGFAFTENFYVYRSVVSNLGATTVTFE